MRGKMMDQTIEFLVALYGETKHDVGFRPIPPSLPQVFTRDFSQVDTLWKSCQEKGLNLCFGVATREGKDGTKTGCREVPALWVDIDFKQGMSRKAAKERLGEFPLPPSAVIQSGNGLHAYWFLDSPADAQSEQKQVEGLLKNLATQLGGDEGACDVSRVMRLPGTLNFKYTPARPCKVVELHADCRYTLTQIEEVLEMKARKTGSRSKQSATASMSETVPEGQRNTALAKFVGKRLSNGIEGAELVWAALKWNGGYNDPPLSNKEVIAVVKNIVKCDRQKKEAANVISWKPAASEIANTISRGDCFAQDAGKYLYVYQSGCYAAGGDEYIRRRVQEVLEEEDKDRSWSKNKGNEVVEYIRLRSPQLLDRPTETIVNLQNGLLNVETGKFTDHTPEHLSPVQLPIAFDPEATCPTWEQFVFEVFPEDAQELAWEIIGYLMVPSTFIQKAILLYGEGGNGKSTFLEALTAFIGRQNVSNVALPDLDGNRFAAAQLVGNLANICADLPKQRLTETAMFKKITGGDTIQGERKHKPLFSFVPYSRLIFSANHLPRSDDQSQGFFDRWLVAPFDRVFRGTKNEIPRDVLDKRLADPKELSGVLNKAIPAYQRLRKTGRFTESKSMRTQFKRLKAKSDPMGVWADEYVEVFAQGTATASDILSHYNGWATDRGLPERDEAALGKDLKRIFRDIQKAKRGPKGQQATVYLGIKPKDEAA